MPQNSLFFRPIPIVLFWIIYLTPSNQCLSQEIRSGEFLVQLRENDDIRLIKNIYSLNSYICLSEKLKIWKLYLKEENDNSNLEKLRNDKNILKAQFNHRLSKRGIIPNDSLFKSQWSLNNSGQTGGTVDADIDASEAWELTKGGTTSTGEKIVVGVIDDGFALNHPDLNFWKNRNEVPENGIDDDENGYIDDYDGWNSYEHSGNITSDVHGTHVSGIIGAKGNNNIGIAGVSWGVNILPVQGSSGDEGTVIESYSYLLEMRAKYNKSGGQQGALVMVTNASFGVDLGKPEEFPIWCSVFDSLGAYGILNVCATTNSEVNVDLDGDIPTTCTSDFIIAVTNTDHYDNKSVAGYGSLSVDLGAPGEFILSTLPNDTFEIMSGTSMATPHVTGAIALLFSSLCPEFIEEYHADPSAMSLQIKNWILDGVDTLFSLKGLTLTGGRLNVNNSILLSQSYNCIQIPAVNFVGSEIIINETGDTLFQDCRKYNDFTIKMRISSPPDTNVTATISCSGNALAGIDYELLSDPELIFPADTTDTLSFTLRIFDDLVINNDKNILCNFELSDTLVAVKNNYNEQYHVLIRDDDFTPETELKILVFSENWSNGDFISTGWEIDSSQVGISSLTVSKGALTFSWEPGAVNYNVEVISKPVPPDSFTHFSLNYNLKVDNYDTLNINYIETSYKRNLMSDWIILDSVATTIAGEQAIKYFNKNGLLIDSLGNSSFQIRFRFYGTDNSSLNEISVDNISISGYTFRKSETNIFNSNHYITPSDTVLIYSQNNKILCTIENLSDHDYQCTTMSIDRDGTSTSPFIYNDPGYFATNKTLFIQPTQDDSNGNYRITLFFNKEEIEGWENETGNQRTNIHILHSGGAISNVTPVNPEANGNTNRLGTATQYGSFGDVFWVSEVMDGLLGGGYAGIKDLSTGLKKQNSSIDVRIFQNNAENKIQVFAFTSKIISVSLYNSINQRVWSDKSVGKNSETINVGKFTKGIYFLKAELEHGDWVVKKIVVY